MIRILSKKQQKEAKQPRFLPQDNIKHETEIAAEKLQLKLTEGQQAEQTNVILKTANEGLKNNIIGLRFQIQELDKEINKKRESLAGIGELIGIRSATLEGVNKVLIKVLGDKDKELSNFSKESKKVKELAKQYNDLAVKYSDLMPKIAVLEKQRKVEQAAVIEAGKETKTIKTENKKKKEEYERYKTIESKTIEKMKFFGDRINRFYQERQMKPPIELPF